MLGPDRLGGRLGVAPSTVHRVLMRHDLNHLSHIDRQSGREIRRYERDRPGELVQPNATRVPMDPTFRRGERQAQPSIGPQNDGHHP